MLKNQVFLKIIKFIPALIIAGVLLLYILCPINNDHVAKNIVNELQQIPLPEKNSYS